MATRPDSRTAGQMSDDGKAIRLGEGALARRRVGVGSGVGAAPTGPDAKQSKSV